jgi:hypothetical protein
MPAAAVIALKVDPGGYWPPIARLKVRCPGPKTMRCTSRARPSAKAAGLKVGRLAIASTSPVRGSSATPAAPLGLASFPRTSWSAPIRARCVVRSMLSISVLPGSGGVAERAPSRTGVPLASTSSSVLPGLPCR